MRGVTQRTVGGPATRIVVAGKVTFQRGWGFGGAGWKKRTPSSPPAQAVWDPEEKTVSPRSGRGRGVCGDLQASIRAASSETTLWKWGRRWALRPRR